MLIIAIPKSASTSILLTIGKYQNKKATQDFSFGENRIPENCEILHNIHSDVREFDKADVEQITIPNTIHKQHIYPSANNVKQFTAIRKVVLLRSPEDIILAYRRGAIKKVHTLLSGYDIAMTENEWIEKSKANGLYSDLRFFYNEWKEKALLDNTLFVHYEDYLLNAQEVINKIEVFFGLQPTQQKVKTIKVRYSRRKGVRGFLLKIKNMIKGK